MTSRGQSTRRYRRVLRGALVLAGALCVLMLGGCGDSEPVVVAPDTAAPGRSSGTPTAPDSATTPLNDLALKLVPIVERGLENPLFLTHASDGSGRLFVVEQRGRVRVIEDGNLLAKPYLDVTGLVSSGGERGLLGLAFAPDFARSGRFYVNYTNADGDTIVARYTAEDPASSRTAFGKPETVLRVEQPYANHNGGMIAFGPDKMLYIGMGDGGSAGDPQNRAQDLRELLGKMLRVDAEGIAVRPSDPADLYGIPRDNPFQYPGATPTDSRLLHRPEIWQWGLRNPWRFSFDRATGDLWIGDVGQDEWEEIDRVPLEQGAGVNWGWDLYEGTHRYASDTKVAPGAEPSEPIAEYDHGAGNSVTGGYVYRGSTHPRLAGVYLYADFGSGRLWGLRLEDASGAALNRPESALLLDTDYMIASFGEDEAGELYLLDLGGGVYRIELE